MAKVCLIDDDIFVRDALTLGLGDAGYVVVSAPGAAAGLDIVARGGVDAIVTDLNMPGVNGVQLVAEARARWPELPIIAITGVTCLDGCAPAEAAQMLGVDACLTKPFRAAQLAATLEAILAARSG